MDFNFLGIGVPELVFILVIVLLVLGPKDIAKLARNAGQWLYRLQHSDIFRLALKTREQLQQLPTELAREAQLEDLQKDIGNLRAETQAVGQALKNPPASSATRPPNPAPPAQRPFAAWVTPPTAPADDTTPQRPPPPA